MKIKAGILGATGYTGAELIRLLTGHPYAEIKWLTSERFTGKNISEVFSTFTNIIDIECKSVRDIDSFEKVDVVFSCLPHHTSGHFAGIFLDKGTKFIDFSSDFRSHNSKSKIKAVYGLPELFRRKIKNISLIANPGCYATAAILGLAPLLKYKLIETSSITIDAKTGLSGGGRAPVSERQFSEANNGISVNSISDHNQKHEIEDKLELLYKLKPSVIFSAYNINIDRGILCTITARLKNPLSKKELQSRYKTFYRNEGFIRLFDNEKQISTKNVRFSNYCDIFCGVQDSHIMCVNVLDNLGKGAAGQAVQNMNIMFGIEESTGLQYTAMLP